MNILLHRPLPPGALQTLRHVAPQADFRHEPNGHALTDHLDWAEVAFGNVPAPYLRNRRNLRWLQIVSSGIDEYESLAGSEVTLTTAHGVHRRAIAQQLMMAMLMFARGQLHFGACQARCEWDRDPALPFSLRGQVVGFIGYGSIAREFAQHCRLHDLRLRAVKRSPGECPVELEVLDPIDGLDNLLQESDHIVLSLPCTRETRGSIDADCVARMKSGAYFYNVARGGIVDEAALLTRLHDRSLSGAAMDVFEQEPLPPESPWWSAPNTLVFPHIAGHHRDLNNDTFALFADNLARYVAGQPLRNVANFERGY